MHRKLRGRRRAQSYVSFFTPLRCTVGRSIRQVGELLKFLYFYLLVEASGSRFPTGTVNGKATRGFILSPARLFEKRCFNNTPLAALIAVSLRKQNAGKGAGATRRYWGPVR